MNLIFFSNSHLSITCNYIFLNHIHTYIYVYNSIVIIICWYITSVNWMKNKFLNRGLTPPSVRSLRIRFRLFYCWPSPKLNHANVIHAFCVVAGIRLQRSSGAVWEEKSSGQETSVRHRQHQLPKQMCAVASPVLQRLAVTRQTQRAVQR